MAAMSGIIGGEVVLVGVDCVAANAASRLQSKPRNWDYLCFGLTRDYDSSVYRLIIYGSDHRNLDQGSVHAAHSCQDSCLAMMFILYIIVRTQMNPEQAPLPEPKPGDPQGAEKWALFGAFLSIVTAGFAFALFLRVAFFTLAGQNVYEEGVDAITYGTPDYIPWFGWSDSHLLLD